MPRLLSCALLFAVLFFAGPLQAADYFGKPGAGSAPAAQPQAAAPILPEPLRSLLAATVRMQSKLNGELRSSLREARTSPSWRPAFAIILLSFLYGVFHAAGPGHGKAVLGSYFLTRRARILQGIGASFLSAGVQAVSAVVLVGLLVAVFQFSAQNILDHAALLEMASYGAIVLLGLWMAWGILRGHDHCHGHVHHHDGHDHHHHDNDHDHARRMPLWLTSITVGLRPCSGAILVLLFTLANGMLATGIVSTFAMAFGVALTVTAVTLVSLGLHRSTGLLAGRMADWAGRFYRGLAFAGALLIAAFGGLELLAIWTGALTPMAG